VVACCVLALALRPAPLLHPPLPATRLPSLPAPPSVKDAPVTLRLPPAGPRLPRPFAGTRPPLVYAGNTSVASKIKTRNTSRNARADLSTVYIHVCCLQSRSAAQVRGPRAFNFARWAFGADARPRRASKHPGARASPTHVSLSCSRSKGCKSGRLPPRRGGWVGAASAAGARLPVGRSARMRAESARRGAASTDPPLIRARGRWPRPLFAQRPRGGRKGSRAGTKALAFARLTRLRPARSRQPRRRPRCA
jgi:hypothetical protein